MGPVSVTFSGRIRLQHLPMQGESILATPLYLEPQDVNGVTLACANNCLGVDPNSVIIGGGAVLAASAIGLSSFLLPAAGVGAGAVGLGAAGFMANGGCLPTQCRVTK